MQIILKIFPRIVLIKLSILLQPLLSLVFKGSKFTDPINGKKYSRFLSYGYNKIRPNALSPGTLSLERHRLLWLYLTSDHNLENQFLNVLHVAPEQVFYKKFKNFKNWTYTTTDLPITTRPATSSRISSSPRRWPCCAVHSRKNSAARNWQPPTSISTLSAMATRWLSSARK